VLLIGFSALIYTLLSRSLYARLDQSLLSAAQATAAEFIAEVAEFNGNTAIGASETLKELQLPKVYTAILERDRPLTANHPPGETFVPDQPLISAIFDQGLPAYRTIDGYGEYGARQVLFPQKLKEGDYLVLVTEPLQEVTDQLGSVRQILYFGLPATLFLAGLGGFFLAKKTLLPVVEMSTQAQHIGATNLEERLTVANPSDELGHLAFVFNELLSRLETSFDRMRQFTADASHELRTPLSVIRGEADVILSQDRTQSEYRDAITTIADEARRLSLIVDDMLALARADAGQHPLRAREFYLDDLLEESCKAMQFLAAGKGITLGLKPAQDVTFVGDEDLIRRLILNLLDNAIKYTPEGGSVSLELDVTDTSVRIIVVDTGIGISEETGARIFERFYRVEKARSRASGGVGLGLSIAKWVVEAHGGAISVESKPGFGSRFTIELPRQTQRVSASLLP
jgi:heavy metal sensor kinase